MTSAGCPRCYSAVALHEGRPVVTSAGAVALWHSVCWDLRDQPIAPAAIAPAITTPLARPSRARPRRLVVTSLAAAAVLGVGIFTLRNGDAAPPREHANVDLSMPEAVVVSASLATKDSAPPAFGASKDEERWPVPVVNGEALDVTFPTLASWIHPVTDSAELVPAQVTRHFGAARAGIERAECGEGHCGVDLDGPRGRPLVAVANGVVVRVERSERGRDGRSGRYVRLQHDDGTLTSYMHMDDVADFQVGDRVRGGQYIGTLGATAVYSAAPHCHFSLELPNHRSSIGDTTDTHYVDPAPFLARSNVIPTPERRHVIKPAM